MKRSRSRNRSGGGGGGGGKPQNNANRTFDSNGPEGVKVRGSAQHVFEKYQQLGRDAQSSGDRVLAENYLQHAEHYFRVLRAVQPSRPVHEIIGRDNYTNGLDIDFEDEGLNAALAEPEAPPAQAAAESSGDVHGEARSGDQQTRSDGGRGENPSRYDNRDSRSDGQGGYSRDGQRSDSRRPDYRDNRSGGDNREPRADYRSDRNEPRSDRYEGRRDEPRRDDQRRDEPRRDENRPYEGRRDEPRREDAKRDEPRQDGKRDETRRDEPRRDERPRSDRYDSRRDRYEPRTDRSAERADPLPVVEPQAAPLTAEAPAAPSPVLRAQDGDVSHAPAFLQVRAPAESAASPTGSAETANAEAPAPKKRTTSSRTRKPATPKAPAPETAG